MAERMRRSIAEGLSEHGVSWLEHNILTMVAAEGGLSQTVVAQRAASDRNSVSEAVLKLEEHELIRTDEGIDRRKRVVYITALGRDVLTMTTEAVEDAERRALLPLDPRERGRLLALSAKLIPPVRDAFGFIRG